MASAIFALVAETPDVAVISSFLDPGKTHQTEQGDNRETPLPLQTTAEPRA